MDTSEGLVRGQEVSDTGAPISVPVGQGLLGRIINVIGDPVDEAVPSFKSSLSEDQVHLLVDTLARCVPKKQVGAIRCITLRVIECDSWD